MCDDLDRFGASLSVSWSAVHVYPWRSHTSEASSFRSGEAMKDQRLQIADIVPHIDDATLGTLNVPAFQRKYVWRASKVVDLVDSLWRGYPVGTLLLWARSGGWLKYVGKRTESSLRPAQLGKGHQRYRSRN